MPRFFSSMSRCGTKEMMQANGNRDLARKLFMKDIGLLGVTIHDIKPNLAKIYDSPHGILVQGKASRMAIHDNSIEVGDWVVAQPPTEDDMVKRSEFDDRNEIGHSTVGVTASVKKYRPEDFAVLMAEELRLLVHPDNTAMLGKLIYHQAGVKEVVEPLFAALSAYVKGILFQYLNSLNAVHVTSLQPGVDLGARLPRGHGIPPGSTYTDAIAYMYVFFGLSSRKDSAQHRAWNGLPQADKNVWRQLAINIVVASLNDGTDMMLEFGRQISASGAANPSVSSARLGSKPIDNVHGDILIAQMSNVQRMFGTAAYFFHEHRRFVLGKVCTVDHANKTAGILVMPQC
jgi:hypothetical protein